MARKPIQKDAQAFSPPPSPQREVRRAQIDISFENQSLLAALFGQFDANLVQVENRLGVFMSARGNQLHIEGPEDSVARARDVLTAMYDRLAVGQDLDAGAIEALITMSDEPTLDGIVDADAGNGKGGPPIMIRTRRKTIVPRSAMQATYMRSLVRDDIIFALGPAGTGKTYLAVAQAVAQLITGSVQRLILSRPAVEAGEKLGFLPGDMKEKVDPYLRPLYDALYDCMPPEQVERRLASGEIEIAPIAFMRGRTLADAFVILDEAQNTTPEQMKMFLTRIGFGSKAVVTGDVSQIDLPRTQLSGLIDAERVLKRVDGIGFTRLTSADVVRHPLVARIVDAYEARSPSLEEAEPARRRKT